LKHPLWQESVTLPVPTVILFLKFFLVKVWFGVFFQRFLPGP